MDEPAAAKIPIDLSGVYEPEVVQAMALAFDKAWHALGLGFRPNPAMSRSIARKIVELAREGERNTDQLSAKTVIALGGTWPP